MIKINNEKKSKMATKLNETLKLLYDMQLKRSPLTAPHSAYSCNVRYESESLLDK